MSGTIFLSSKLFPRVGFHGNPGSLDMLLRFSLWLCRCAWSQPVPGLLSAKPLANRGPVNPEWAAQPSSPTLFLSAAHMHLKIRFQARGSFSQRHHIWAWISLWLTGPHIFSVPLLPLILPPAFGIPPSHALASVSKNFVVPVALFSGGAHEGPSQRCEKV